MPDRLDCYPINVWNIIWSPANANVELSNNGSVSVDKSDCSLLAILMKVNHNSENLDLHFMISPKGVFK